MDIERDNIFKELFRMLIQPWSIAFTLYFLFVIVVINGLGVLLCPIIYNKDAILSNISQNLAIYSLALFAPSLIILILQLVKDQIHHKPSFTIISVVLFGAQIYIIPAAYQGKILYAVLCTIIAWFYWIIANRDEEYLNDESFDNLIKNGTEQHGNHWPEQD
ncbi:hypothetical protein [Tannerella forsythia]|uniref:Uncharacterized protein n=1 Tax=Tannerella forsythia TaxID=28112 RepID=A0A2A6E4L3_TANFO|nr:hypothetical protein [Tannerella forsythia]OLQ21628.1 hypothetical protein BGK60_07685 [Tannerella forsythia]PDP41581.1 hypothetical protein CLI86_13455 [Tannerella forsythia]